MQLKCLQSAKEFMKNEHFGDDSVKYESHFNKKLNKCFVRIESVDMSAKAIAHSVVDVLENKDCGACLEVEYKTTPLSCWMADQKNRNNSYPNYYEWMDASKAYMNE